MRSENTYFIVANIWFAASLLAPIRTPGPRSIWSNPKYICLAFAVFAFICTVLAR